MKLYTNYKWNSTENEIIRAGSNSFSIQMLLKTVTKR